MFNCSLDMPTADLATDAYGTSDAMLMCAIWPGDIGDHVHHVHIICRQVNKD